MMIVIGVAFPFVAPWLAVAPHAAHEAVRIYLSLHVLLDHSEVLLHSQLMVIHRRCRRRFSALINPKEMVEDEVCWKLQASVDSSPQAFQQLDGC
jgi:hypothetical protein